MTRRRPIAAAIVRRAEVRAALQDLARNPYGGLTGVVALILATTAWIFRNAAGLRCVCIVPGREPVAGPLPDIADHVIEAVAIGRKSCDGRRAQITIGAKVLSWKLALPGVGH